MESAHIEDLRGSRLKRSARVCKASLRETALGLGTILPDRTRVHPSLRVLSKKVAWKRLVPTGAVAANTLAICIATPLAASALGRSKILGYLLRLNFAYDLSLLFGLADEALRGSRIPKYKYLKSS